MPATTSPPASPPGGPPLLFPVRTPFKHKKPESLWPILETHGFKRVSGSPDSKTEKWSKDGEGGRFIVRMDKQGHKTEHHATGRKAHGGRAHYHKEWTGPGGRAWYQDNGVMGGGGGGRMTDKDAKENHIPR